MSAVYNLIKKKILLSRLLAFGTTLKNTGVIHVYTMGRELSRAAKINMDFGLNCVTFRGSSLVDRRLAAGDFGS